MSGLDDTVTATGGSTPGLMPGGLPTRVGRFEIEGTLGEGGNGVVLLARDPRLARKVAIKILRGADDGMQASQRLFREAQSAAKLAHDNVIVIHEVGTFEHRVYVAMEYIAGSSLKHWQLQRDWREVLDCYLRAARGLVAAHAAGLVHRDFKPDNVLVANDGRVRVTDFGIVSVIGVDSDDADAIPLDASAFGLTLTRTGALLGTPRYMAPEQHLAEDVDARADQFAFCVALYEALYQRLPFEGASYAELSAHVVNGDLVPPPAESRVPPAIRAAIVRGLSRDREARFASMTELLDALAVTTKTHRRPRRRWALAAALFAIVASVAAWRWYPRASSPPRNTGEEARDAFLAGEAAYERHDFSTAVEQFKRAFAITPNLDETGTAMLFNMGQAYRQLGNCAEASFAFKKFLALRTHLPDGQRERVEHMVSELDACAAQQAGSAQHAGSAQ